ncbi:hypothetical protein HPULCUR_008783 [Helicostylum pulchrum]|uniref:Hsp70 family protein n=1 Tax=Helicostylum pulchrum TaxID=562976 RepID=A0ABP9Y8K0_9FUNG
MAISGRMEKHFVDHIDPKFLNELWTVHVNIYTRRKVLDNVVVPEQKPDDTFEKTPTACLYSKPDHTLLKWGKSAIDHITATPNDPDVLLIDQFKLKLHTIFQNYRTNNNSQLTYEEKQYWNAAVDYLREIYQYTCHQLIQTVLPRKASEKDFRFVLTVPATWVTEDNACMRLIAIEAGLVQDSDPNERLVIINEAFAASLFCEREFCIRTEGHTKKLVKGQRYLVCDAGGGTVDLATYECTDTSVEQKGHCQLALESGGCCGSTILDKNMESYLRDQVFLGGVSDSTLKLLVDQFIKEIKHYFGDETGRNNYIASTAATTVVKQTEPTDDATTLTTTDDTVMKDVHENDYDYEQDYLKHSDNEEEEMEQDESCYDEDDVYMDQDIFSDDDFVQDLTPTDYVYFTLPPHDESFIPSVIESLDTTGNIVRHAETAQLRIKSTDMSKFVFDPVVENVMSLIRKQVRKSHTTIETLFLLGGFGQSSYLYKKLHYEFITCTNAIQHLIVPEDGYRASMRGGIYHGIDCIDIITKDQSKINTDQCSGESIFIEKYDLLIGIDIDLFDLTATFHHGYDFFRKFRFDSERFIQYNFRHIVDTACEDLSLLIVRSTSGDTLYYKCLIKAFIHQLHEQIQHDYEELYPKKKWQPNGVRYCISIAQQSTNNLKNEQFDTLIETPMSILKQDLLKMMTKFDQLFQPKDIIKVHSNICQLFDYKASLHVNKEENLLKMHVLKFASEIGMMKGADIIQGYIVWVGISNRSCKNYPYFDIICEDFESKGIDDKIQAVKSMINQMINKSQENVKIRTLTLDLKLFSRQVPVEDIESTEPLLPAFGPSIYWEFESIGPTEVERSIDAGNYKVEEMLKNLAGMINFMGPHVLDYINRQVIESKPSATHTLGDLFLIPGTDKLMFMQLPFYSVVNKAGLLYAIRRFKHHEITSKLIQDVLIRSWIKYRLIYMIRNTCESYLTDPPQTLYLFLPVNTGLKEFFSLRLHIEEIFGEKFYLLFNGDVDFTRHVACLALGVNTKVIQKWTRVTERRYAVHILTHDVKKQDTMAQHMYSRLFKKRKTKDNEKKDNEKKDKKKEDAYDEVLYTTQEGAFSLLHSLVDFNVSTSSIVPNYNPFLQFKVPHACSIAIVLYASREAESSNNTISNNSFRKLHRFIFPIKDITKAIEISCKVEKYELIFTVKQDDYEADYRCIDFLELN